MIASAIDGQTLAAAEILGAHLHRLSRRLGDRPTATSESETESLYALQHLFGQVVDIAVTRLAPLALQSIDRDAWDRTAALRQAILNDPPLTHSQVEYRAAQLIAAVPDLLDALERLTDLLRTEGSSE